MVADGDTDALTLRHIRRHCRHRFPGWLARAQGRKPSAPGCARLKAPFATEENVRIPQALPASKMASAGPDFRSNARTQILWGMRYIRGSYVTPYRAWLHEMHYGWY
jgi:hypothetical protein